MIELDRLRYDLVHGTPADEAGRAMSRPGAVLPEAFAVPPWLATMAGSLLAGYGLTCRHRFSRICFLSAAAGLVFYGWKQDQSMAGTSPPEGGTRKLVPPYGQASASPDRRRQTVEPGDEHPIDVASQGSFPASDPPSLSSRA